MTTESTDRADAAARDIAQQWGEYNFRALQRGAGDAYVVALRLKLEAAIQQRERDRMAGLLARIRADILTPIAGIECNCDDAYTRRGRHEPNAWHRDFEDVIEAAREVLAALAEGEG